ncbi:hypothetical protein KBY72_12565, partial [Cyanobium sp. BA5m-21]|uniref:hypothetical protein n=1 Tax=Cyanobium sp. BA5m-21 TaxID=2823706 RepID=UPI0020CF01B3
MANFYFGTPNSGNGTGTSTDPWNQAGINAVVSANTFTSGDILSVISGPAVQLSSATADIFASISGDLALTDTTITAVRLNSLDAKTSGTITATTVTSLTGSAGVVAIAISATGINLATDVGVTLGAGTAPADTLNTIDINTTAVVDATALTLIWGSATSVKSAITSAGINTPPGVGVDLNAGAVAATDLIAIDANTTAVVS